LQDLNGSQGLHDAAKNLVQQTALLTGELAFRLLSLVLKYSRLKNKAF
jgi:hypothetical protein